MALPLAYYLTWTTYGTWLPGDRRGWVSKHDAAYITPIKEPDPATEEAAREKMRSIPVRFDREKRRMVDAAMRGVCEHKGWILHQLEVRSNHLHVIVSPGDVAPGRVMAILKAYASKVLNQRFSPDKPSRWWTEDGSTRWLFDESSVVAARKYVLTQDVSWLKHLE